MGEVTKIENLIDSLSIQKLIEFLEYEEALTRDANTAKRIKELLKSLGIWS
jgi:hypothetical protein